MSLFSFSTPKSNQEHRDHPRRRRVVSRSAVCLCLGEARTRFWTSWVHGCSRPASTRGGTESSRCASGSPSSAFGRLEHGGPGASRRAPRVGGAALLFPFLAWPASYVCGGSGGRPELPRTMRPRCSNMCVTSTSLQTERSFQKQAGVQAGCEHDQHDCFCVSRGATAACSCRRSRVHFGLLRTVLR